MARYGDAGGEAWTKAVSCGTADYIEVRTLRRRGLLPFDRLSAGGWPVTEWSLRVDT